MKVINRESYINRIKPFMNTDLIKVITGIRRSGKSIILQLLMKEILKQGILEENIIYYNFEDFKNRKLLNSDKLYEEILNKTKDISGKIYLFLDEIQEVPEWEVVINSLRLNPDFDIYITGSNAKLLSSELSTYLAGRYIEFRIYPFTFSEFRELYSKDKPNESNNIIFLEYITLGGMPYLAQLNYNHDTSYQYLHDLYNSVYIKDILVRNNFRDVDLLDRILNFIIGNNGHSFSANSIAKYLKSENRNVSVTSIVNYLKAFEEAYLISRIKKEDLKSKKRFKVNEKVYLADHGFHNSTFGTNDIDQIYENIILNEILSRNYHVTVGKNKDKEVDFIATKNNKRIYIQVCYQLSNNDVVEREFGSLESIKDNFPKYVISSDKVDFSRNGIIHKNIVDFLMDKSW